MTTEKEKEKSSNCSVNDEETTPSTKDDKQEKVLVFQNITDDAVTNDTDNTNATVSREEMLDLVRAVKFAKPEASMREVHREITQVLSEKESFEFLSSTPINDIKKVWKKACNAATSNVQKDEEVLKMYTVGNGTIKTLIEEYSQARATTKITQQIEQQQKEQQEETLLCNNYVHVFLDVPADRSGLRPHQALINFNTATNNSAKKKIMNGTRKKKGKAKKPKDATKDDNCENGASHDGCEIMKIQIAAAADGDNTKHPMLLYNRDRSSKTFIHPEEADDNTNGYDCIRSWIQQKGVGGALGMAGGSKSYFYAHRTLQKHGSDILSIDITKEAPPQNW